MFMLFVVYLCTFVYVLLAVAIARFRQELCWERNNLNLIIYFNDYPATKENEKVCDFQARGM